MSNSRLHVVLVTYSGPKELATMLRQLAEQERPLESLVVMDNRDSVASAIAGDLVLEAKV